MPTKKDLAALPSATPQQPLRRGRGLRLSRAHQEARQRASMASVSPVPERSALHDAPATDQADAAPAVVSDAAATRSSAVAEPSASVLLPADPPAAGLPAAPEREKRKIRLRKDLLKQCKRLARAQDRKLYQVIEAALEEYLQRHGAAE